MAPSQRLRALEARAQAGPDLADVGVVLRRAKTGEVLQAAGGVWDRRARSWTRKVPRWVAWDLEESQVEFFRWYATFVAALRDGRERDTSLAMLVGGRRSGKTLAAVLGVVALLLDAPLLGGESAVGWVVNASYQDRDEVDRYVLRHVPRHWYRQRLAPHHSYEFVVFGDEGYCPVLKNVSADDPEALRRGRVDVALFNDAQKMRRAALVNAIYGTADKGGLGLLTANPPRRVAGEWVSELKAAVDEQRVEGVRWFHVDPALNTKVDRPARSRVGGIVRLLDPRSADADDEGKWLPVGDRAYHAFDARRNVVRYHEFAPDLGAPGDVTASFLRRRSGRAYPFVGGVDFNGSPHHAGVVGRLFQEPGRPPGQPTLLVVEEVVCEQSFEDDFLDEVDEAGYLVEELLWVGDASGQWQTGKHDQRGGESDSYKVFRRRRWHVVPPKVKETDRGEHSKNPRVEDRLRLVNALLAAGRVKVDGAACPKLVEALRECPVAPGKFGGLKPYGFYSHVTDALGYLLYYLFPPAPRRRASGGRPAAESFPEHRPGLRGY